MVPGGTTTADGRVSAKTAGLRHVHDGEPGLHRRATGRHVRVGRRRWVEEFVYEDARGRRVRDARVLDRIRALAIPPAWQAVWICADSRGHLQATGRDARGRKQYRYHPRWREERDSTKYDRMAEFGEALVGLRRRVDADLALPGLPRAKVLAAVVRLLETTFIRVGNEEYARTNGSFGLTTLKDRHVDIGGSRVRFHFRGKSGVFHQVDVRDPRLARIVRRCRDLPGQELFQYLGDDGRQARVGSADVNAYIRECTGRDFTAKDFRTWAGTVMAAMALCPGPAPMFGSHKRARPTNRAVVAAIRQVAERLGNTPAVCRKSYVHPHVIAAYFDGTLPGALGRPRSARAVAVGLRPEEKAVLRLLQHRGVEKHGSLLRAA